MDTPRYTSKRGTRLTRHHPIVTLAEAMTRIAFGRSFASDALIRFRRRNRGRLPQATEEALDAAGKRLAILVLDSKLTLRGELQEYHGASLCPASIISPQQFLDGLHFDPSRDVIEPDMLLDRHFNGAGYPLYRHVRLDMREVENSFAGSQPRTAAPDSLPMVRARGNRGLAVADAALVDEILLIVQTENISDTAAATRVVARAAGVSDDASKIKRLVIRVQERRADQRSAKLRSSP